MAELPSPPKGRGPNGSMQSSRPEVTNPVARFLLEAEWGDASSSSNSEAAAATNAQAMGAPAVRVPTAPARAASDDSDEPPSPLPAASSSAANTSSAAAEISRIALLRTNSSTSNISTTLLQDPGCSSGVFSPSSSLQSSSTTFATQGGLLNEGFCLSGTGGSSGGVLSRQSSNNTGFSQLLARSFDDDTQVMI